MWTKQDLQGLYDLWGTKPTQEKAQTGAQEGHPFYGNQFTDVAGGGHSKPTAKPSNDSHAMLNHAETKRRLKQSFGSDEAARAHVAEFHAKPENYKPRTFYRVEGAKAGAGVGEGLYVGKDKQALNKFYNLEGGLKVHEYRGEPKFADLMDYGDYAKFEAEAKKKYGKLPNDQQLQKLATAKGYDGIRYYDPEATGEEFVLYDTAKLERVKPTKQPTAQPAPTPQPTPKPQMARRGRAVVYKPKRQ